jgi:type IV pilus assembly protein PilP
MGDLKKFVEDTKAAEKGAIAPLPAIESYPPFLYAAEAVRDPFVPLDQPKAEGPETKPPGSGLQPDRTRPKEELEAAPLDALRMMGTLAQQGSSWALVRNVDGVIHRVKPGNYLGQNYGKIVSISDDKVDLVEIIPDGADSWRERNASLALSQ